MNNDVWIYEIYRLKTVIDCIVIYQIILTASYIFNATKINFQLLTGTMFILLSKGAESERFCLTQNPSPGCEYTNGWAWKSCNGLLLALYR